MPLVLIDIPKLKSLMDLTKEMVDEVISGAFRRCDAARLLGGIALRDVVNGQKVPNGWAFDELTEYYVPSIAALDASNKVQ